MTFFTNCQYILRTIISTKLYHLYMIHFHLPVTRKQFYPMLIYFIKTLPAYITFIIILASLLYSSNGIFIVFDISLSKISKNILSLPKHSYYLSSARFFFICKYYSTCTIFLRFFHAHY